MFKSGIPLTRENYIGVNYMGQPPEPWTADHELDLPEVFQRAPG